MIQEIDALCVNTILEIANREDNPVTHMKIQKLLYFSTGRHLAKYNSLIVSHPFQAWENGPVLPQLNLEMAHYGDKFISEFISYNNSFFVLKKESRIYETIKEVMIGFMKYSPTELSEKTHVVNGPWWNTVHDDNPPQYQKDIPFDLIKKYFQENNI